MENGTLDEYVRKHPTTNRVQLVSTHQLTSVIIHRFKLCRQIYQVAQGLQHMHEKTPPIIHGDLKAVRRPISVRGLST